jgi:membrane associated rhomboid family serine protease
VIPIRDDNPHFLTPLTTYGFIGLSVFAWVFVQGMGSEPALVRSVCDLGLIPGELLQRIPAGTVIPLGEGAQCLIGSAPAWHTLVTSMFLHGSWAHILGNLWFLWIFGNNVEDSMGHTRFVLFYLACGLAAAALQILVDPGSGVPMVGASGAIGGVMGGYVVLYPRVHVHLLVILGFYVTTVAVPAFWMLGYWLVAQLLGGLTSIGATGGGVAFWAHVGGFAAGALLVRMLRQPQLVERHPYRGWERQALPTRSWHRVDR